ncbi:division plane positioning ATPase MipZ [Legionella fairfieldensis]|uniref:division plane positioning ATPase MipZ n=1 Tax=Legionella fairfieldensis TaxID=45064 RepID=UPI000685352F|nr:division plane positioning ATPase MipZ [Legionella fairfieldensis]
MTKVIVIGGEKGGTGKTTVAVNLAIMRALMNYDTLYIDADKQRSGAKFFERRNGSGVNPQITCVNILGKHLNSELDRLATRYENIVVDVGGRDSVELRSSLVAKSVSDWYSPIQPSEFDMDTLETIEELSELSQSYNPNLKTHIILNSCSTHAQIKTTDEAKTVITESFPNLNVCKTTIGHRVSFKYSISNSFCVVEFEANEYKQLPAYRAQKYLHKASNDMIALYEEIYKETFLSIREIAKKDSEVLA